MTNNNINNIHFEVAIEGVVYCYNNFNEARDEYYELVECGFYEAVLRRVYEGEKTVYWNDRSCCFMG